MRRRNIFALSGKDEADPEQVESFNTEYFENLNNEDDLPQSEEAEGDPEKSKFYPHGLKSALFVNQIAKNVDEEVTELTISDLT